MYLPQFLDLRAGFSRYFRVVAATDNQLRDACFRIRHDVYCRELNYEPLRRDGLETDAFDAQAVHCLLQATATGLFVGCIRLVRPAGADPDQLLPFEKACGNAINRGTVDPRTLPRDRIAEVSRLAVVSAYRRRKGEPNTVGTVAPSDFGSPERPRFPYLVVGLYLGMMAQARHFGLETLFLLTEPRLARHLALLGVDIKQIGTAVEHRGMRVPSMVAVNSVIDGFGPFVRPLYEAIAAEIELSYRVAS